MKNKLNVFIIIGLIIVLFAFNSKLNAQAPPHPPASGHAMKGDQTPGPCSAPIGNGVFILLALGFAYATKKMKESEK